MINFDSFSNANITNKPQSPDNIIDQLENLSDKELAAVKSFSESIDLHNYEIVINYGKSIQKQAAMLADKTLKLAKSTPYTDVTLSIAQLVYAIAQFSKNDNNNVIADFFDKIKSRISFKPFDPVSTEETIDLIEKKIIGHTLSIEKDIKILDKIYLENMSLYKSLTMYIKSGEFAVERAKKELDQMKRTASINGNMPLLASADSYFNLIDMFEQKLYDIRLTRTICLQYAPQIQMIKNSDILLLMKLQSSIVNTISTWKRSLFLTVKSENALKSAKTVAALSGAATDFSINSNNTFGSNLKFAKDIYVKQNMIDVESVDVVNEQIATAAFEYMDLEDANAEERTKAQQIMQESEDNLKNKFTEGC